MKKALFVKIQPGLSRGTIDRRGQINSGGSAGEKKGQGLE